MEGCGLAYLTGAVRSAPVRRLFPLGRLAL